MSAPTTNVQKQKKRHRPPLMGIVIVAIAALALFAVFTLYVADGEDASEPSTAPAAIPDE